MTDPNDFRLSDNFGFNLVIPGATILLGAATAMIATAMKCPPLEVGGLGAYAVGLTGVTGLVMTDQFPRLSRIVSLVTPAVALAFASAGYYAVSVNPVTTVSQPNTAQLHIKQTLKSGQAASIHYDPAHPGKGAVVHLNSAPAP
ncbi:MAG: hypothetical protein WCD70_03175 [Alphaproteobacteria bacterium]